MTAIIRGGVLISSRSLARRRYPGKSEEQIATISNKLALISDKEYALCGLSCSACHELESSEYHARRILVENLSANCNFCEILRKCQQQFGKECKSMLLDSHGRKTDIQICFRKGLYEYDCKDVHVQLYSKGLF